MSVLRVENLSKRYGKKQVLKGITCEFHTGINALLGPNGAGKTTIMNCISSAASDVYKRQSYTAHEFLRFSALLKGMPEPLIEDEIRRVLGLVNLSENLDDKIKSFSGGMKQRLAIAQTILNSPEILIFDEPSAGLDPFEREQFKRIMVRLKKDSIIIISTHIVSDIDTITDDLIILNKGSVIANDSPEALFEHIRGMVWDIPKEDIGLLPIENIYYEDTKSKTISKTKPTPNAVISEPTMNDLYFCGQLDGGVFE